VNSALNNPGSADAPPFHVVLVEPEIPQNTGNIARTCLAIGARLHLIEPLGFTITDKQLNRAGMDYWKDCDVHHWANLPAWQAAHAKTRQWLFTTKSKALYCDVAFQPGDALIFGRETRGLPESLLAAHPDQTLRLPMRPEARSLNLATSVGIALYEAARQIRWHPGF
jgi:tRNA (cytidine/uridine-2'-O-)-methyltransferase